MGGGLPPWAAAKQDVKAKYAVSGSRDNAVAPARRPSLAGGLPPWAPSNGKDSADGAGADRNRRRSSLAGGMPAWAPPTSSPASGDDTGRAGAGASNGFTSNADGHKVESALPVLPDWIAAATGGGEVRTLTWGEVSAGAWCYTGVP